MKILYISPLCSKRLIDIIHTSTGSNSGFAVQKFNRMVAKGLVANNIKVSTLSVPPGKKMPLWCHYKKEREDRISYRYISFINLPLLKHLCVFLYSFGYVLLWGVNNRREKAVICDVLTISACLGAVLASKINGIRTVGIMTDMPGLMVNLEAKTLYLKVATATNRWYLSKFDCYVFLTEQMNVVNKKKRPYIVMEGLVDGDTIRSKAKVEKISPRVIMYAGGLHARYGLQMLIDAVKLLPNQDIQLVLYGDGPIVKELEKEIDKRIVYKGSAPNELIVEAERRATLLVNPRPTHEEFTKYSFPSKNMEYMASGTPLLTTKLPGMPKDYYPFIYLFEKETTEGYAKAIADVLSLDAVILQEKGRKACEFVLYEKNNKVQTRRIIDLLSC